MKRQAIRAGIGICVILSGALASWAQDKAPKPAPTTSPATERAPRLEVSPLEVDFGEVWYGEDPISEFVLKNTGNAPLKIVKINTGCGCTTVNKPKTELAPGESDVLRVKYQSKKKRAGKVNRSISIHTNDPEHPVTRVKLVGDVKEIVKGDPVDSISFGQITGDEPLTKSIELTVSYDEKLFLKLKEPLNGPYDVKLDEIEPGVRYRLTATTRPNRKSGPATMEVPLLTGIKKIPQVSIRVRGIVVPRVSVSPPRLYIPPQLNRETRRVIRVSYLTARPVEVTKVESDFEQITAELRPPPPAPKRAGRFSFREILVNLPPGKDLPKEGAKLTIYTNDTDPRYAKFVVEITNQRARRAGGPAGMRRRPPIVGPGGRPQSRPAPGAAGEHRKHAKPKPPESGGGSGQP